jgi:polyhydroxyalkanoate synthesis regulator phasin
MTGTAFVRRPCRFKWRFIIGLETDRGIEMETVLQLLMEGVGTGAAALAIMKENMNSLVQKGVLSQSDLDEILQDVERSLAERRQTLFAGFQKEIQRLLAHLPLASKEDLTELEQRFLRLEERLERLEAKGA